MDIAFIHSFIEQKVRGTCLWAKPLLGPTGACVWLRGRQGGMR